jgi:hypothetical protein
MTYQKPELIEKSIGYETKWILKKTARFFPTVGIVFAICLK